MKKTLSVIVILCIVLTAFAACAPKPEKAILGTWKGQVTVLGVSTNVEYTFNENGSGIMTTDPGLGVGLAMNYTITDTALTVTTDTPLLQKSFTYTYAFDGDTLTLTDANGSMTLTKDAAK